MRLRQVSRLMVVTLVVVVGVIFLLHGRVWGTDTVPTSAAQLQGTDLGSVPAADFTLADQNGTNISLAALRGQPVVLTFMDSHCTDQCASKLQQAVRALGGQADQVRWLAVSVDPAGDTPESAQAFVTANGLAGRLHFLLGTQAQLQPVWDAYHVAVVAAPMGTSATSVTHTNGVYVLDSEGRERVFLGDGYDPNTLTSDLRILLES